MTGYFNSVLLSWGFNFGFVIVFSGSLLIFLIFALVGFYACLMSRSLWIGRSVSNFILGFFRWVFKNVGGRFGF